MTTIGTQLATWRFLHGLSAAQVAERAGVSRATVAAVENGRGATLENVLRVAKAVGVLDLLETAADPWETAIGRARADQPLPRRLRHAQPHPTPSTSTGEPRYADDS